MVRLNVKPIRRHHSTVDSPSQSGGKTLRNGKKKRLGATAIEYAMIASLISVAVIAGVRAVGVETSTLFSKVDTDISQAVNK